MRKIKSRKGGRMMNPIINPWLIYLAEVLETLRNAIACGIAVSAIISLITVFIRIASEAGPSELPDDERKLTKLAKKSACICVIMIVLNVFIPSKTTVYTMIALQYTTPNNIEHVGGSVTDFIGDIAEAIDSAVNKNDDTE